MAVKDPANSTINSLTENAARLAQTGVLPWAIGDSAYHYRMMRALWLMDRQAFAGLRVLEDDASDVTINVRPGRATVDGTVMSYAGGTVDLASYGDDTVYVWAENNGADAVRIDSATDATGWPTNPHVKLAEVTIASSAITAITDRRAEAALTADVAYAPAIETQGSTGGATRVHITGPEGTDYLRVRVCDEDGYTDAANATIAAAGSTSVAETVTATKDLVLKSSSAGLFELDLTDATAETVTLRIGPAPLSARRADYRATLDVTHA